VSWNYLKPSATVMNLLWEISIPNFYRNKIDNNKIALKWDAYRAIISLKNEIYRLDVNCNVDSAELIATITDINQSSFIDAKPQRTKKYVTCSKFTQTKAC
jgi:hypothetical protein